MKYSVIIPTYNEIRTIVDTISTVRQLRPDVEIIVSDGGSIDGTADAASKLGAAIVHSEKGRGIQMNAGASIATGDILLFLHSDTSLSNDAFEVLDHVFINDIISVGSFRLQFDNRHWFLRVLAWFTQFDSIFTSFGDHCIVIRKSLFTLLGGFQPWQLFEDVEFLQRVRRETFVYKFHSHVTTSARRFEANGIYRQQLRNVIYGFLYHLGVDNAKIAQRYNIHRHSHSQDALIIFARYPVPGKVKTRLASSIGFEAATDFYRMCAEHIFTEVRKLHNVKIYLFFSDGAEAADIARWVDKSIILRKQEGDELGDRMSHAFDQVFSEGAKRATIIGTDIPSITNQHIQESFQALHQSDTVIGPSNDGGYYLLGLNKNNLTLFQGISWSTPLVFQQTTAKLIKQSQSFHLLATLDDIDTVEDLQRWSNHGHNTHHPIRSWIKNVFAQLATGLEL